MTSPIVKVYTTRICPYCVAAKTLLKKLNVSFEEISLEGNNDLRMKLSEENNGWRTVPMIFVGAKFVGGFDDLNALHSSGKLLPLINSTVS